MNVFCPICWHKLRAFSECKICKWTIFLLFLLAHVAWSKQWMEIHPVADQCASSSTSTRNILHRINYSGFWKCSKRFLLFFIVVLSNILLQLFYSQSIDKNENLFGGLFFFLESHVTLWFLPQMKPHQWFVSNVHGSTYICVPRKTNKWTEINEEHCDCLVYTSTWFIDRYFMQSIFILNKKTMQHLSILFRNIVVMHTHTLGINKHCSGVIMSACNVVNSKRSLVKCHDRTQLLFVNHFWCTHLWGAAKFSNFMWNVLPNVEYKNSFPQCGWNEKRRKKRLWRRRQQCCFQLICTHMSLSV